MASGIATGELHDRSGVASSGRRLAGPATGTQALRRLWVHGVSVACLDERGGAVRPNSYDRSIEGLARRRGLGNRPVDPTHHLEVFRGFVRRDDLRTRTVGLLRRLTPFVESWFSDATGRR